MNQRKPLAEWHPEQPLRPEDGSLAKKTDPKASNSNPRQLANRAFMRSLSQLEHTLVGDEVSAAEATIETDPTQPVPTSHTAHVAQRGPLDIPASELDEFADAVADIEAYMRENSQHH